MAGTIQSHGRENQRSVCNF